VTLNKLYCIGWMDIWFRRPESYQLV